MSVRSNSIVTLDTRIQGARSLILLPFFNAFAMLLLFRVFFYSFTMMCMALYTVVMLQEFEIWSLALNFISFIISFHPLFATNFGHAVDACIYIYWNILESNFCQSPLASDSF